MNLWKIFFLLGSLLMSSFLFSQNATITGTIKTVTNKPIENASVFIETTTHGTTTNKIGWYEIKNIKPGNYVLKASTVGYEVFSREVRIVAGTNFTVDIQLIEQTKKLDEVIVTGRKKLIEQKNGMTIINVENSILSEGSNALEILQRSPGVTIDDDGNINMRGKQGVKIMMNGKLSYLSPKELAILLKGTPSSSLKSVELITSPSAKYDASGYAGIINLVLKKEKKKGLNGNVYTYGAMSRKFRNGAGININSNYNRLNIFGSYDYAYRGEEEFRSFNRQFPDAFSKQYSKTNEPLTTHKFKAGLDYDLSEKTTAGILWTGSVGSYNSYSKGYNNILNNNSIILSNALTDNTHKSKWNNQNLNLNFQQKFGAKDHLLAADFDYSYSDFSANQLLISDFQKIQNQNPFQAKRRGSTPSITKLYVGKTDYIHHFNDKNKLEAGWKSSWVKADNDAKYDTLNTSGWAPDLSTTNHFIYDENINAFYASYATEIGKWQLQGGLRYEHTISKGTQVTTNSISKKNYGQWFPNFSAGFKANDKHSLLLAYSRRIQRPDYDDLNPFRFFVDPFLFWEGNPALQPELAHSLELSHDYKGQLHSTIYFTYIKDVIADVLTQLPQQNITIRGLSNLNSFYNIGATITYIFNPVKWWTSINTANVFQNRYQGSFAQNEIHSGLWTASFQSQNNFNLGKGFSAELMGKYNTPEVEGVFRRKAYGQVDAGLMKKFNEKLSMKFSASDIFRTLNYETTSYTGGVHMNQNFQLDSRVFNLTLTYRFGNLTEFKSRKTGADDIKGRIRGN